MQVACLLTRYLRNGGHINPPLFDDWEGNKERYGERDAKLLVQFRLAHVGEMRSIAAAENILDASQVRVTEHLEVYLDEEKFQEARDKLARWQEEMPDEASSYVAYEGTEATQVRSGSK